MSIEYLLVFQEPFSAMKILKEAKPNVLVGIQAKFGLKTVNMRLWKGRIRMLYGPSSNQVTSCN